MRTGFLFAFIIAAAIIISCAQGGSDDAEMKPIILTARAGQSVFELLRAEHEVDYTESGMGVFIKAIDGRKNSGGHFWIYYVNGEKGQIACDKFIVSEGDKIEWRYE